MLIMTGTVSGSVEKTERRDLLSHLPKKTLDQPYIQFPHCVSMLGDVQPCRNISCLQEAPTDMNMAWSIYSLCWSQTSLHAWGKKCVSTSYGECSTGSWILAK